MRNIFIASLLCFSNATISAQWYEDGNLGDKNAMTWQEATLANKIATSADFVSAMRQKNMLASSVSSNINSLRDIAPYAIHLAICIDETTEKEDDPELNELLYKNQKVNGIAVLCASFMNWLQ